MNIVLQEKLVEIIELGEVGVLKAIGVLKEQAPELLTQFMAFATFSSSFGIFAGLVLIIVASVAFLHLKKMEWDLSGGVEFLVALVVLFAGIGGISVTLTNGYNLSKILIAPNVYILENLLILLK